MLYFVAYLSAFLVFAAVDAVWLSVMGPILYKPTLGDILLTNLKLAPAIVFYLVYPVGLIVFAILPGLKAESLSTAVGMGALFGAFAYATYDLTNYATLRNWTLTITAADIIYGAIASGAAAGAAYLVVRGLSGWLGQAG